MPVVKKDSLVIPPYTLHVPVDDTDKRKMCKKSKLEADFDMARVNEIKHLQLQGDIGKSDGAGKDNAKWKRGVESILFGCFLKGA